MRVKSQLLLQQPYSERTPSQKAAGNLAMVCAKATKEFFRRGLSGPPRNNVKKFLNTLLGLPVDLQVLTKKDLPPCG